MRKEKILAAMSGGVDSSVAAALLVAQGFEVGAAYMKNWMNEPGLAGDCPWQQDIEDARAAASRLGIPFRVVNLMTSYRKRVVEYLLEGYRAGITPNPDVMCNREIKFGAFLDWAIEHGFDAVATGHYAQIRKGRDGRFELWEGADKNKDQSYFLALLQQRQLARARFPVGAMAKPEVREAARRFGLPNAEKKDSQGICFIGKVKMRDFLRAHVPDEPGRVVDVEGRGLGMHRGLHLYTLGQRRGVGIASPVSRRAYVVVGKRPATNELVVALESESAPGLYATACDVGAISFPCRPVRTPARLLTRPRYRARAVAADIGELRSGEWRVEFSVPQRALAPGQIAAFYEGEQLVAGGIIQRVFSSPSPTHGIQPT